MAHEAAEENARKQKEQEERDMQIKMTVTHVENKPVLSGEILLSAIRCAGCVVDDHNAVPIVNGPPLNFDEWCELRDDLRIKCYIPPKEAFKLLKPYSFYVKHFDLHVLLISQLENLVRKKGLFGKHLTHEERDGLVDLAEYCRKQIPEFKILKMFNTQNQNCR